MHKISAVLTVLMLAVVMAPSVMAKTQTFDFKDPKGVNAVGIFLDGDVEQIFGVADGIAGTVTYDPQNPSSFKGEITLAVSSIRLANKRMTEVLMGAEWLAEEKYKTIKVKFLNATVDEKDEDGVELDVKSQIMAMGKTIDKTLEITADYVPDGAEKRGGGLTGDLLVLTCEFEIDRRDLGIKPDMGSSHVAHKIELTVGIAGYEKK